MIKARAVLLSCEELSPQLLLLLRSPLCSGPAASPLTCGVRWSRGFGGGLSESRKARGSESVLKLIRSPTASGSGRCVRDEALGGEEWAAAAPPHSDPEPRRPAGRRCWAERGVCAYPDTPARADPVWEIRTGTSRHLRSRSPLRHIRNIQHSLTYTGSRVHTHLSNRAKVMQTQSTPPPPPHTHTQVSMEKGWWRDAGKHIS